MRIGIDATCWANGRGYGRFARELVGSMLRRAHNAEFVLFADERAAAVLGELPLRVEVVVVPQSVSPTIAAAADQSRAPRDMLRFTRAVWRARLDVFFSPSVYTYFPLPPRLPSVVTIHDAIAERFPSHTLPSARARLFWRLKTALARWQATLVLTSSDYAADQLAQVLGLRRDRLRVSGAAPAPEFSPDKPDAIAAAARRIGLPADAPWFVYVGGFNPHKMVDQIVRAHARIARGDTNPPHLLLVGTVDDDVFHGAAAEIRSAIVAEGSETLVHWTGFVSDGDLRPLLAGATALVLPSLSEGFGLPAIEAAACGTPVVATTESPLPALLEGGGYFVPPGDLTALTAAMQRLLDDPEDRRQRGERALLAARRLTWDRAADETLAALTEAAHTRPRRGANDGATIRGAASG